jgi:hypothetical protein
MIFSSINQTPIDTGLIYDTLDECYQADDAIRKEYTDHYNTWNAWAKEHLTKDQLANAQMFMLRRDAFGICVPRASKISN